MIDTFKLVEDLKSRINPAYANQIGTESHERAQCVAALEQLQVELMAKQQHLAGAFSQVHEAEKENSDLREQLAQERKRLDWALNHGASYVAEDGDLWWSHPDCGDDFGEIELEQKCTDPRATIDEIIASEAAGGGK